MKYRHCRRIVINGQPWLLPEKDRRNLWPWLPVVLVPVVALVLTIGRLMVK